MRFENKVYDVLKWIATLLLPALGTFYFTLASIWNLPYSEQVVGTIMTVDALLGVLLGISSASYKGDGTLILSPNGQNGEVELMIDMPMDDIRQKKSVVLAVEETDEGTNLE